jgi:hypothetical protein
MVESLYAAAIDTVNNILQTQEISSAGEYWVNAGVVSPAVNVIRVNIAHDDLAPLVYTEWPNAIMKMNGFADQTIGHDAWHLEIPRMAKDEYLNRTVVDDVFKWGPEYQRRPPVFALVGPLLS